MRAQGRESISNQRGTHYVHAQALRTRRGRGQSGGNHRRSHNSISAYLLIYRYRLPQIHEGFRKDSPYSGAWRRLYSAGRLLFRGYRRMAVLRLHHRRLTLTALCHRRVRQGGKNAASAARKRRCLHRSRRGSIIVGRAYLDKQCQKSLSSHCVGGKGGGRRRLPCL